MRKADGAEAEARRQRRIARLRRASRLPPGKTFETLDTGRLPGPLVQQLKTLASWPLANSCAGPSSTGKGFSWHEFIRRFRAEMRALERAGRGSRSLRPTGQVALGVILSSDEAVALGLQLLRLAGGPEPYG